MCATRTASPDDSRSSGRRAIVEDILSQGDIQIDGDRPWDIHVHDDRFYRRVLSDGALGLGESYMERWWDAPQLDQFFYHLLGIDLASVSMPWKRRLTVLQERLVNRQSRSRAFVIGERHYDRGNDLFQVMLDRRMTYTCGYWKNAKNLDEAQEAKLDLTCRKIGLNAGDRVLDVGCGWGSFLKFAAENYGARGVGVTVSAEQVDLAREMCQGLPVEIRLQDYRAVTERFDHIVSLGMFEHVGPKNYRAYFQVANRCLEDEGLFLLHTVGNKFTGRTTDPFTEKYIFPNSVVPSIKQIGEAIENLFIMEDWHNFSACYDPTLMAWNENFEAGWPQLRERYGEAFYRMWRFFLLSGAASFRVRKMQLWQVVLSKRGVPGGYESIRA